MDLSIIIVSWNVRDLLRQCLSSIFNNQGGLKVEIFVVDNASVDGTVAMMQQEFPEIRLIANKKNRGFAAANNQAIKQARGKYILLLNPDTEIMPETLSSAINFLTFQPRVAVVGGRILNSDFSIQPSVRNWPTFWPIFLMLLKLPKIFPNLKSVNHYLARNFDYHQPQSAPQIMGAFMMIRREIIDLIGLFDERFFIWFEEVDFCRRVWQAGYQVYYWPKAKIIHYGGQSFAQQKIILNQWRFFQSAWRFFQKHGFRSIKL